MNTRYANFIPKYDPHGYDLDGIKTNAQYVREEYWRCEPLEAWTDEMIYHSVYSHAVNTFMFVHQTDRWPYPLWSCNVNGFRALPSLRMFNR